MARQKKASAATESQSPKFQRKYRGTQTLHHDLFKLKVENMAKNVSIDENNPVIVGVEHAHFFHTIDSQGRPQDRCNPVGGHFHMVTPRKNKDGSFVVDIDGNPIVEVSKPLRMVQRKNARGKVTVEVENVSIGDGKIDEHVHEVEYMGSDKIQARKINAEAMKFEGQMRQKFNPSADGVFEGA
jgi:hypothetical protein